MEKEFIPYSLALIMNELGFKEQCFKYGCKITKTRFYVDYNVPSAGNGRTPLNKIDSSDIRIPIYRQAFKWFAKEHGLYSSIVPKKSWPDDFVSGLEWYVSICGGNGKEIGPDGTYSYKEAELACLNQLIKLTNETTSNKNK